MNVYDRIDIVFIARDTAIGIKLQLIFGSLMKM